MRTLHINNDYEQCFINDTIKIKFLIKNLKSGKVVVSIKYYENFAGINPCGYLFSRRKSYILTNIDVLIVLLHR